jgi:hypothetical protein
MRNIRMLTKKVNNSNKGEKTATSCSRPLSMRFSSKGIDRYDTNKNAKTSVPQGISVGQIE